VKALVRTLALVLLFGPALAVGQDGIYPGNVVPSPAFDGASLKVYKYRDKTGAHSFSDRPPEGRYYEVIQLSCFACNPHSSIDWHSIPLQLDAYSTTIEAAAREYGVDPALVRAVIHAESAFRAGVVSKKGAMGLMQLMPGTARDMGVSDAFSPEQNIRGGVRYLALMLERNGGDDTLATASYNAGPGAVERYHGIPPFEETQTYVKRVRILKERYRKALADRANEALARQSGAS